MSGRAMFTEAPVSMVAWHGFPWIQPSATRLLFVPWDSILSVNRGVRGDDAGSPLFTPALTRLLSSGLSPHAAAACSLFSGGPRHRTASIQVVHPGGVEMAVVSFLWTLLLLLVASLVARLLLWPLPASSLDLVPKSESGRRPSGGAVSLPGPILHRWTHGRPLSGWSRREAQKVLGVPTARRLRWTPAVSRRSS